MRPFLAFTFLSLVLASGGSAQIAISSVTTTATQAVLQYTSPVQQACSVQVADMNRSITVGSVAQSNGSVTIQTLAPHGLVTGTVVYLENAGAWNGWQTITSVPSTNSFVFASSASGGVSGGNVGVLVDDVNPNLFPGANLDSRPGSVSTGQTAGSGQLSLAQPGGRSRTLVIGKHTSDMASDGNRYSRALQTYSRHHLTLTCGTQSFDQEFRTNNMPLGDTYNIGPPVDRKNPGQYAYPTIQWSNQAQTLIDPVSGLRSARATAPTGTASTVQTFTTAIDSQNAWQNDTAPLRNTGGAASFTGPCASGTCALFLRADSLALSGGATYATTGGVSLDWVKVTINQASISGNCTGDDCKLETCLTVNGIKCASGILESSLSMTPGNFTLGTGKLMDLWQTSGAPAITRVDASTANGTINYTAATQKLTLVSGNPFNIKWTAGSMINVGGAQYTIASVQSERSITLVSGPPSDVSAVSYTANNFGLLMWKKTPTAQTVSIGYTTFQYGSSVMAPWSAQAQNDCSTVVTANGVPGYNCFIDTELYWFAADGSDIRDLGMMQLTYWPDGRWSFWNCGQSGQQMQFDPQNGDEWYCMVPLYYQANRETIVQAHYMGDHSRYTPGKVVPDCGLNGGAQPCIQFTIMQPNVADAINQTGPAFNPDFTAANYQISNIIQGGISSDSDMFIYAEQYGGQDTLGWMFVYTLGDRTPTGTTANSFRIIASTSTYRRPPLSWCTVHSSDPPDGGWALITSNSYFVRGPAGTYSMQITNSPLNTTLGAAGGLNVCPANKFGVTGSLCTDITVNGEPTSGLDGSILQNLQVGDVMMVDNEYIRVLSIVSSTEFIGQRGYLGLPTSVGASAHTSTKLIMSCGTQNSKNGENGLWNYRNDPYGTNENGNTIVFDPTISTGHHYLLGGASVAAGAWWNLGEALCPSALLTTGAGCTQVRQGTLYTATLATPSAVAVNPPFAGKIGLGNGNQVDTHPGPCFNGWCTDGHPMDGGNTPQVTLGTTASPFVNVSGQLWKVAGAQSALSIKFLPTAAYVGRTPLVDISGHGSILGNTSADSYKYCYALTAGECVTGSAAGDFYVNTPYVSYPYCYYAGVAIYADDVNSICVGNMGPFVANLVQFGITKQDSIGAVTRRLGPNYVKWNQMDVFWNAYAVPSGGAMASQVRWLDGVRSDDLASILPPFPAQDSVARNTFYPVKVTIDPPRALAAQSAIIEFGYSENGDAGNYYCTSRQETCVAVAANVNLTTPFYYEQSESFTPASCATGCTITVPALPQHVLYYRWKYLGAGGQVIESSQMHVVGTP